MDVDARPLPDLPALLAAVEEVSRLYPLTPPLVFWRAYERAIYGRLIPHLPEPVLDVGCGDGAFFSLLWPDCREVDGIDCDPAAVAHARASGRYQTVWEGFAHDGPLPADRYGAAVSNCALEHMDEIDAVLRRIRGSLRPGGVFAATVVTDRFVAWNSLPGMFAHLDDAGRTAAHIQSAYEEFHHLRNAFPAGDWEERFRAAGFTVERAVPFLGEFSSRLFLFLDNLWHLGSDRGIPRGPLVEGYLAGFPEFPLALQHLVQGAYLAERDRAAGSGLFLLVRRAA